MIIQSLRRFCRQYSLELHFPSYLSQCISFVCQQLGATTRCVRAVYREYNILVVASHELEIRQFQLRVSDYAHKMTRMTGTAEAIAVTSATIMVEIATFWG